MNEFGSNFERHRRELLIHCYRMLGSLPDAEDAVQETSLRAWRYRDSLKEGAPLRPWLYRVATNACLDAIARDERRAILAAKAATDEPAFDLSKLPSLDSITAATDIRPFLARGVPSALTRAALRRVWTADPAIRDFVGLAENAWDFTDPNAMPGFGPLETTDEVRRMIADVVRQIGEAALVGRELSQRRESKERAQVTDLRARAVQGL